MFETKLSRQQEASAPMRKVDGLGWTTGFALKSYGVRIGIRSNDAAALERVRRHLPSEWQTTTSCLVDRVYSILVGNPDSRATAKRLHSVYGDEARLARSPDLDSVFEIFESDLRLFVAELATHRVFVHAGVVGWKGQGIVIPGRSYSGKSTLVAELVRAGATYYSDEYAVFDARGRVHPFSKPIELREEGKYEQRKVTATELGGRHGTKPLPVGLVLMTRFERGARWRPRTLTPGKGVLELLFNTVSARRSPERALATLRVVATNASLLKGVRGNATEVVDALLKRVENK
ncbi:MAG TPA: hypothetical protein VIW64_09155 [Pyrinomonadaceae bacterium]|jgi:hypothetical protein